MPVWVVSLLKYIFVDIIKMLTVWAYGKVKKNAEVKQREDELDKEVTEVERLSRLIKAIETEMEDGPEKDAQLGKYRHELRQALKRQHHNIPSS